MVQELERSRQSDTFPSTAPTANPVFYRTYSRRFDGRRETWQDVCDRTTEGLIKLGQFTPEEADLIRKMQRELKALPSGRWLWVGGSEWMERSENFSGAYNCTSTNVIDWRSFGLMMDLAMMGCGTGAVLEAKYIEQLPAIQNRLNVKVEGAIGTTPAAQRREITEIQVEGNQVTIYVGDSRQGWVQSYQGLLELASDPKFTGDVHVTVNISDVRPEGEPLKGFGGVANPIKLPELYQRCAEILNRAIGRQLTSVECCLLIDEAALVVVAGNVRRCLPENALVHTSKGLIPIKDVQVGDMVQTPLGFRKVLNKFDQGFQDVYDVETNAGTFRATLNHRQAVMSDAKGGIEWKQIGSLQPEDRLMHNTKILPGVSTHLPPDFTQDRPQQSRTCKDLIIPELTHEVAWLIGFTQGDGYVSLGINKHGKPYGEVAWASNSLDTDLIPILEQKINGALSRFGLSAIRMDLSSENTVKFRCLSIRLAEYFLKHIKQPNNPLQVPDFILQGTAEIRAAYLAGLVDSDGSLKTRPPILVTTIYQGFARQVSSVLSSLGIPGRTKVTVPKEANWQPKYSVTIPAFKSRYNNLIGLHSAKGFLKDGLKMYGYTIPGSLMRQAYTYSEMREMGFQGSVTVDSNYERYSDQSGLDLDIPVTVKGIGAYDHVHTYDIEVDEAHCFYCDGYLTHNSAGMRQGGSEDELFAVAKDNLWQQDAAGNWRIDPERDALRMANHTRVYHHPPTEQECIDAVRKQFYSGEGAIQYAPEAIARANADILTTPELKTEFLQAYIAGIGSQWIRDRHPEMTEREVEHRLERYALNPCGEINGSNFHCNLSEIHLNQLDPLDFKAQQEAFAAGALAVAALLNHRFAEPRYQYSRELDPIVGVSFTGLFDFFVNAFGVEWLRWWAAGRPDTVAGLAFKQREQEYLTRWRDTVHRVVWDYCDRHGLRRPNRCTTVQPAGTKSLLSGASPGWHPPKAQRFIRRITFRKNDPVALACLEYGYSVVPSQSDKDENGNLLNDPFDPRCTEWLVEIPVEVSWASFPGADEIEIEKFSALAQMDFYLQVQKYYTAHNTSATVELREDEIEPLARRIYQAIEQQEGYISAALLARYDAPFPRLPFEKIDRATYDRLRQEVTQRKQTDDFHAALLRYDLGIMGAEGPAGCDSDKCMMPEKQG